MRYPSEPGRISPSKADEMALEAQPIGKKRRISVCVGCGSQIHDQYIMRVAPDLEWHAECLKCADCAQYLDESCTCYVRDGKTYCKRDYLRLFGTKCSQCLQSFGKTDFVMRAKNKMFHVDCFRCAVCNRALVTGDEFALRDDGLVYCKLDNDSLERASSTPCQDVGSPGSVTQSGRNEAGTPNSAIMAAAAANNNNNNNSSSAVNNNNIGMGRGSGGGGGGRVDGGCGLDSKDSEVITKRQNGREPGSKRGLNHKGEHKTTRVRTVLNEKQLHTLRTCYNANPRPDALMKEQLTEMTGLSPRVIRVWFQNKRCKDKKRSLLLKQIQQQQEKSGQLQRPLNGVPMVASSPVRHEGPPGLQANPVEVQSYQTPWKALSEFAMQGEMDHQHPPFQQLMNTFEHMDPGCHGSPPHPGDLMMHSGYGHHPMHPHDDMPNSVGSDFPGTPSETMSSPLSQ